MSKSTISGLAAIAFCVTSCSDFSANRAAPAISDSQSDGSRVAVFETSLRELRDRENANARDWSVLDRMKTSGVPGVSVAIIRSGEITWLKGYGVTSARSEKRVNEQTVFSAGSVSKLVNAALILRLVQEGKLDLDKDVNTHLTSWKVPENNNTRNNKVTLRMLLSHTSGFSQHGFPDFQPDEDLPTAIQTLNGTPPAKHDSVRVLFEPGEKMKYSGGGVTVSQLIVEDVTGLSYPEAARKYVFDPLEMGRSTFVNPLPETHGNIAKAHDEQGKPRALPRGYESMPEMAASGLWTSAKDMAKFMQALLGDTDFLSDSLRDEMLTRVPNSWHGLGPRLNGSGEKAVFHHGGANDSYQSWVEGHPATGNGIVILTNGRGGRLLAYEIRISVERALGWRIHFPDDFDEPKFE